MSLGQDIDERITAIALHQHGVIQRRQLLAAGVTAAMVESRLRSGILRRVHTGVYLLGHLRGPLEPRLAAEMAAVLACGRDVLVSHRSAAGLHELLSGPGQRSATQPARAAEAPPSAGGRGRVGKAGAEWRIVDVAFPGDRTPTRRRGIRGHRAGSLETDDRAVVEGVPVTAPARTILDLSAVVAARELEGVIARAERLGLVSTRDLRRLVDRCRGRAGAPLLRSIVEREGGALLTRSEAEARFADLVRGSGLPTPEANVMVHGYEVDFLWRDHRVAVEVDGFAFHASRHSFAGDRRRDADLLVLGIRTMRITWSQIVNEPKSTLVRLALTLAHAGHHAGPPVSQTRRPPGSWPGTP